MLALGLVVGFSTVLLTSHASLSDRMLAIFCGLTLFSIIGSIYFGVKAFIDWRECERKVNDILQVDFETNAR
jgi:hypothetical protein